MLDEFKKFILKGNVVDLSTGVIIGAAFGKIVEAFTKGIVEPILALAGGGPSPKLTIKLAERMMETEKLGADGKALLGTDGAPLKDMVKKVIEIDLGAIIGAGVGFLITAAVVFFVIVKPVNKLLAMMKAKEAAAPAAAPAPTTTEVLLAEIRDSLKR